MSRSGRASILPYIFTLAYAIILVQVIPLGFNAAGMRGVFIATATAYVPLGLIAGSIWSVKLGVAAALAGIPAWVFIVALEKWSLVNAVTKVNEGIPVVLEPVAVSVFFLAGAWTGNRIHGMRRRARQSEPVL